jgi:hypothetical protein
MRPLFVELRRSKRIKAGSFSVIQKKSSVKVLTDIEQSLPEFCRKNLLPAFLS